MKKEFLVVSELLQSIISNTPIHNDPSLLSTSSYNEARINLINYSTIQSFINLYNADPTFSLEEYLISGTNEYFTKKSKTPSTDIYFIDNYHEFYEELLKAFIEENYMFDEDNNIIVSSDKLEALIPAEWLFKLNQSFKKDKFTNVFFYHKNPNIRIKDEQSLEKYLYQVKTFMVTINEGSKSKEIYAKAELKTNSSIDNSQVVKVDNVIETFKSNIESPYRYNITKFKIPSISTLINRAGMLGSKFYSLPLKAQQELLKTWILEYLNTNELAIVETQKLIAAPEERDSLDNNKLIVGLFSLYIQMLNTFNIDFDNLSLSSFRIKEYASPQLQRHMRELRAVINEQESEETKSKEEELVELITTLLTEIKQIDVSKKSDLLAEKQEKYFNTLKQYEELKLKIEPELQQKRNSLQNIINYEQSNSIEDLAFDYNTIMNLILGATKNGRIYINPYEKEELIIEIFNKELGIITFKTKISLNKLLDFINNNMFLYQEQYTL